MTKGQSQRCKSSTTTTMMLRTLFLILLSSSRQALGFVSQHADPSSKLTTSALSASPRLPNFCSECGGSEMQAQIPPGDDHLRAVCQECNAVVYENPKVVVSCVIRSKDSVLLAKRAIEPRAGYWGIPQGYMELEETTRQAICREVREETGAEIKEEQLSFKALYNVPGSVQLVYAMSVENEKNLKIAETTTESTAVEWFPIDALPELCFPTVQWAIDHCCGEDSGTIQQKNKLYDAETGVWSESEDMDAPVI